MGQFSWLDCVTGEQFYKMNAVYESCAPSKYDPNQGWLVDEYGNQVEWYEDEYQNTRRR